jgi:hypothetical protein
MTKQPISLHDQPEVVEYCYVTDRFARPVQFRLLAITHSDKRAREVLETILPGVKVLRPAEISDVITYMSLPGVFDERGKQIESPD